MTKFIRIAGSPTNPVAILGDDGCITSTGKIDATPWTISPKEQYVPNLDVPTAILCQSAQGITTTSSKSDLRYLTSLANQKATWKTFLPVLQALGVVGMVGDPMKGFAAINLDAKSISRVSMTDAPPAWKTLTSPIPFIDSAKIANIAGDNISGVIIVSDESVSSLASLGGACESWTLLTPKAPIKIEQITGDCINGFIVYGEGQLYSLDVTKSPVSDWKSLPSLNFSIVAISGNPKDGVVALIGDGNVVVYCKDVTKGPWCVALVPDVVVVTKSE